MRILSVFGLLLLLFGHTVQAFTLVPNRAKFPVNNVTIRIAGNDCSNNSLSPARLLDLGLDAMDEYWNRVPTSAMKITGGSVDAAIDVSGDTLSAALAKAPGNTILIGCSADTTMFDDVSILGVGTIGTNEQGQISGALLVNDALIAGENHVASLADSLLRAVLAHESGHALGIGHSGNPVALMYYSIGGKIQERLTQDDYDALTYLYPRPSKIAGCGQVTEVKDGGAGLSFVLMICVGFLVIVVLKPSYNV
ncbi:MAG: hypothetical protein A2X86_11590 [Bdellovibrionales bacterium GWA2_49_15]|nr:MAG: hypothetical protein A2X86_11590 [Bdellovibrionales bacterium GWA2_49_15]HAZ12606.1 hypothetical protein [Bdellovibrionales bacterium]